MREHNTLNVSIIHRVLCGTFEKTICTHRLRIRKDRRSAVVSVLNRARCLILVAEWISMPTFALKAENLPHHTTSSSTKLHHDVSDAVQQALP